MARIYIAIAGLLLAVGTPLHAQSTTPALGSPETVTTASAPTAATAPVGPALGGASVAARMPASAASLELSSAARNGGSLNQSKAMMIVGVAGLLAGAVIGGSPGTVIMIGGAVIGLVGLYDYLQ